MPKKIPKPKSEYFLEQRKKFGKSIRELREEKMYSQEDLATIMEMSRSTISKIENGKFAISIDYIVKFCWYLGYDFKLIERK